MGSVAYIIVVFNLLHQQQGTLPGTYSDMQSCQVALAQQHFNFTYWGACRPVTVAPPAMGPAKGRHGH